MNKVSEGKIQKFLKEVYMTFFALLSNKQVQSLIVFLVGILVKRTDSKVDDEVLEKIKEMLNV